MRDDMKCGDLVFFYHSNTSPPHIGGIARVVRESYPDHTSWDAQSKYYDPKSSPDFPRWYMVDISPLLEIAPITLEQLKENPRLQGMAVLQRGQRLSVQSVSREHFDEVLKMANVQRDNLV